MLVHVLVLMVFVDGHLHAADLREHHITEAGLHHQLDTRHRIRTQQHLVELDGHPLDGDSSQLRRHRDDGLPHPVGHSELELGDEPGGPQHPKRIIGEGHRRGGRGVQDPLPHRRESTQWIEEFSGSVGGDSHRHRVGREVPSHEIVFEAISETHLRVSRHLVVAVGPESGDLEPLSGFPRTHGAVGDPGIPHRVGPRTHDLLHRLRRGIGGEIEVGGQSAENRVADATAHQIQLVTRCGEQPADLTQQRILALQLDGRASEQLILGHSFGHVR